MKTLNRQGVPKYKQARCYRGDPVREVYDNMKGLVLRDFPRSITVGLCNAYYVLFI